MSDNFQTANDAILNTLQELTNKGVVGDGKGGMIMAYLTVVELVDSEGHSRVFPLFNDPRTTVLFGLLQFAQLQITAGVGIAGNMHGE